MATRRRSFPWLSLPMGGVYLFLYAPIAVLVVFSFNDSEFTAQWEGATLRWYGSLLGNRDWLRTGWNSLVIAGVSTALAVTFGTMAAMALERTRFRAKQMTVMALYLPIVVPDLIMGIALAVFYGAVARTAWSLFGIRLPLGKATVVFAHVAFNISFVAVVVRARFRGIPESLEEAALDLGATRWQAFWRVQFPLLAPGIFSGGLLAFTNSIDDFVVTYFTAGPGATTLSLKIFSTLRFGVTPEVNAISALLLANSTLLVLLSMALGQRHATAERRAPVA
jgi:spermidine/putrescine transport system permease protein